MNRKCLTLVTAMHVLLTGGLLAGQIQASGAEAGWLEKYQRECAHADGLLWRKPAGDPLVAHRRPVTAVPSDKDCAAFAERISALTDPSPEARLALFVARERIGGNGPDRCAVMRSIADDLPNHPFPLFFQALCTRHEEGVELAQRQKAVSLLRRAVAVDPEHALSLVTLIAMGEGPAYRGEYPYDGLTAGEFAAYAAAHYRITGDVGAARKAFEAYLDAGDTDLADSLRDRVRADLSLDALDLSQIGRDGSLSLACAADVIGLGLADHCLAALDTLIGAAAAAGEAVPDDMLAHLHTAFGRLAAAARQAEWRKDNVRFARRLAHQSWVAGRKAREAARLRALLECHPVAFWSSEHHKVYATMARVWGERVAALRQAVPLDPGNLHASCELAAALELTGGWPEARALYAALAVGTYGPAPCDPEKALRSLDARDAAAVEAGWEPAALAPIEPYRFSGGSSH